MRTDHHAYQRATQVAGFGFLLQLAIGLTLLVLGIVWHDTALTFASFYVLFGLIVWISLMAIFYQHKLERLEALEEDELAASRTGSESVFAAQEDQKVAARRLRLMHQWLMPAMSLLVTALLGIGAYSMFQFIARADDPAGKGSQLNYTTSTGWALAICLGFAAIAFIFSRFVAGMAKQPAWRNLRGGAGYMVGNALVCFAIAVAVGVRILKPDSTAFIDTVTEAIPYYMIVIAGEIILNFILNMYRPRIPGEVPRPAFDSRILSLFAAPDSIVRTLNEAVNYQFGFDITSSWGYQLLLRSFGRLVVLGIAVLVFLSSMVVVEPHQQAIRLSGGEVVGGRVYSSGILWKWPWPIETAEVYDVTRVKTLPLTAMPVRPVQSTDVNLWTNELKTDSELEPFVVGPSKHRAEVESRQLQSDASDDAGIATESPNVIFASGSSAKPGPKTDSNAEETKVSGRFSLVDALIVLQYRIKTTDDGLMDYLRFASDQRTRRQGLAAREAAIKALALREITRSLSVMAIEDVLAGARAGLSQQLRDRIQAALDEKHAGVEAVAVNFLLVRPSGEAAQSYDEVDLSRQARLQLVAESQALIGRSQSSFAGNTRNFETLAKAVDRWRELNQRDPNSPQAQSQKAELEQLMARAGGEVAFEFSQATTDRLVTHVSAKADATQLKSQRAAYNAAPRLYRQRRIMEVFANALKPIRKFVIGLDPARVSGNVQFKELDPVLTPQIKEAESNQGASRP